MIRGPSTHGNLPGRAATRTRITPGGAGYSVVFRSDDSGAAWRLASPAGADQATAGDPGFNIMAIADAPGGGFIASTVHGLVRFK